MKDTRLAWPARLHAAGEGSADFERECVDFFAEIVQVLGVPKSVGQIYGLLYASPEPQSFSDIVERLEVSKGSVSQGLRLLRSLGAIKVARPSFLMHRPHGSDAEAETSRRDYYEPEMSLRKLMSGVLRERVAPLAATGADRLARLHEIAGRTKGSNEFYLDRAGQLGNWQKRLRTILPVLRRLLGPNI